MIMDIRLKICVSKRVQRMSECWRTTVEVVGGRGVVDCEEEKVGT